VQAGPERKEGQRGKARVRGLGFFSFSFYFKIVWKTIAKSK
jgi:hypothetical protein